MYQTDLVLPFSPESSGVEVGQGPDESDKFVACISGFTYRLTLDGCDLELKANSSVKQMCPFELGLCATKYL